MAAVTNLLWLNPDSIPENIAPGDTVTAPGDWTFTGNVSIGGNLTVTGSITSGSTLNSVSHDAFFDLGFGYLLNTANQPGGFTLDTRLAAGFVSGQVTNFPTLTTFTYTDSGGCTPLAANDVVMITNLPPAFLPNEGYYIVQAVSGPGFPQTVTIYNLSQTSTPWANTSFTTTGAVVPPGNAAKINLAIVAVADGTSSFKDAAGVPYPVGKVVSAYITDATLPLFQANGAYEAIGATTLQEAYDNGNTIVTAAARDIAFTLTSGNFTVDGAGLINQTVTGNITSSSAGTNRIDSTGNYLTGVSVQANSGPINIGTETFVGGGTPPGTQTVQIPSAGNNTFVQPSGFLQSPSWPAPYPANADGYTVFSGIAGVYRTISGTINTESNFDFVRVYDGTGTGGTLLYQVSGNPAAFSFISAPNQTFTVRFNSDSIAQFAGFNLTVTGSYSADLSIGTGAGARPVILGALTSNVTVNALICDVNANALLSMDSNGPIAIGTDPVAQPISIGTSASARAITIGNTSSTTSISLRNGSGTIDIGNVATSGIINIAGANSTVARSINIGTGATGAKTISIGSTNTTSATSVFAGTSGLTLSTAATSGSISLTNTSTGIFNIANDAGTGTVNIVGASATSARSVNIATGGTAAKTLTLGSTALTSTSTMQAGTGGIVLTTATTGPISVGNDTSTGTIFIGSSTGARQIDIGNGATSTGNINIAGSGATGARTIDVGTGGTGTKIVRIGNETVAVSTTTIFGGTTGGINIGTTAVAVPVNIATNTTAGTTSIGTGTATQTVNINTGAGVKTTAIGSTNTTSTTTINGGGSGSVNIATTNTAAVNIANGASGGDVSIANGNAAQSVFIATGTANPKTVILGSTNTSSPTTIRGGGGISITVGASPNSISLGNDTGTGDVNIVGAGATNTRTLNIGTGGTNIKTINMGSTVVGSYIYDRSPHIFGFSSTMVPGGIRVFNNSGGILAPGTIVVTQSGTSAVGGRPFVVAAAAGTANIKGFTGVIIESLGIATEGNVASVAGTVAFMTISPAPAAANANLPVYLSTTAGQGTMTAPSASGTRVYLLGFLTGTTADANGNYPVQLYPQYIADIP